MYIHGYVDEKNGPWRRMFDVDAIDWKRLCESVGDMEAQMEDYESRAHVSAGKGSHAE